MPRPIATIVKCPVKKLFELAVGNTCDTDQTDKARERKVRLLTLQINIKLLI